jgi:hypothetical protein
MPGNRPHGSVSAVNWHGSRCAVSRGVTRQVIQKLTSGSRKIQRRGRDLPTNRPTTCVSDVLISRSFKIVYERYFNMMG